jgi:hypothetical protein
LFLGLGIPNIGLNGEDAEGCQLNKGFRWCAGVRACDKRAIEKRSTVSRCYACYMVAWGRIELPTRGFSTQDAQVLPLFYGHYRGIFSAVQLTVQLKKFKIHNFYRSFASLVAFIALMRLY